MTSHQTVRVGPCGGPILPPDRMLDTVSLKKKKKQKKPSQLGFYFDSCLRVWCFTAVAVADLTLVCPAELFILQESESG